MACVLAGLSGTHHFVVQLLCRDVGGQHAVGAGVQQTPDEGLLGGGGAQLEHLEGSDLDDPVWGEAHPLYLLVFLRAHAATVPHLAMHTHQGGLALKPHNGLWGLRGGRGWVAQHVLHDFCHCCLAAVQAFTTKQQIVNIIWGR